MADEVVPERLRVAVDGGRCQGHNRCVVLCPQVFEPDDYGYSVVKLPEVGPELAREVRLAEQNCPERAISVTPANLTP